jgi:hypothetical protein
MISPLFIHSAVPSTTATSWLGMGFNWAAAANTGAESNVASVVVSPITVSNMFVRLVTASGASGSYTYTLMKNGVATSLAVIMNNVTTGSDTIDSVSYSAGDTWSVQVTVSGTPVASGVPSVFVEINGVQQLISTTAATISNAVATYYTLQGSTSSTTNTSFGSIIPTAGTINNLYFHTTAPGAAKSYTCTLVINGVDSALTSVNTGAGVTDSNDSTHSVSVSPGDVVYWRIDPSGTPTAARVAIAANFNPTTDGESIQTFSMTGTLATTAPNQFTGIGGGGLAPNTSAPIRNNQMGTAFDVKKLYVSHSVAPGTGASYTTTMNFNAASTALTVPITDSATTGNDTTHTLTGLAVPNVLGPNTLASTGTVPTASQISWGYVTYRAPVVAAGATSSTLLLLGVG